MTGRKVGDVLAETIESGLSPIGEQPFPPVSSLSDEEVLALADLRMNPAQDKRQKALLAKQQAGELTVAERVETMALLRVYEEGLLRKSQGLAEAVRRGLRPPLEPCGN